MKKRIPTFLSVVVIIVLINQSCIKPSTPKLITKQVTDISFSTATSGGDLINDGRSPIVKKGVCWNIAGNPTVQDSKTNENGGSESFTSSINWLTPNTTYYLRAYAENGEGIGYGDQLTFTTRLPVTPVLTTTEITMVTQSDAIAGGNITSENDGSIIEKGVCFDIKPNPTLVFRTVDGSGTGIFISNLSSLLPGNTYYARAYAKTIMGVTYGNEISFNTLPVIDADGNSYSTVGIGSQVWLKENLKTTRYNDGTIIPLVTSRTAWDNLTTDGYCWYDNDPDTYKETYGALYNWYVIQKGKICPDNWHVPNKTEWNALKNYLGPSGGYKLFETGTTGFNAFTVGLRTYDGYFLLFGTSMQWWSSSSVKVVSIPGNIVSYKGIYWAISGNNLEQGGNEVNELGNSIRCIWDKGNVWWSDK